MRAILRSRKTCFFIGIGKQQVLGFARNDKKCAWFVVCCPHGQD